MSELLSPKLTFTSYMCHVCNKFLFKPLNYTSFNLIILSNLKFGFACMESIFYYFYYYFKEHHKNSEFFFFLFN